MGALDDLTIVLPHPWTLLMLGSEKIHPSVSAGLPPPDAPAVPLLHRFHRVIRPVLVILPALGLVAGFGARLAGAGQWSGPIWAAATVPVLGTLLVEIVASLRRGDVGLDIVAALSMTGALAFGEHLAAVVVALMYAGGQYLESFAERRANREMTALLARVPRTAVRHRNGRLEEVPLDAVEIKDRLLIRQGDVVPVDGVVVEGVAILDQSALTGESIPVQKSAGEPVMSGVTNVGDAFDLSATHRAAESTYAGIVRLIEAAQALEGPHGAARGPVRHGVPGDDGRARRWCLAMERRSDPGPGRARRRNALPPDPSRARRHRLGRVTRREGRCVGEGREGAGGARPRAGAGHRQDRHPHTRQARIVDIRPVAGPSPEKLLQLAASLDQASKHVIARALVSEAQARGFDLRPPTDVEEIPGEGLEGTVDGCRVVVGGVRFVSQRIPKSAGALADGHYPIGSVVVAVAVDGELAGLLILADSLRSEAAQVIDSLRRLGIARIILASGDRHDVAEAVTVGLHLDEVHADLTPERKIAIVQDEKRHGPVMMIGDGVNDAPALAAADLGVAMGAKGAAASAEAADVVLLVDRLDKIPAAIQAARRSRHIALQSVYAGIGLSVVGMIVAGLGYLTPVQGALIQEAIDVAVILNALRALWGSEPS